jgi:hypothetical protein
MSGRRLKEISDPEGVKKAGQDLGATVIKGVNLTSFSSSYWKNVKIDATFFLGCWFDGMESPSVLQAKGAIVLPRFTGLPYEPFQYRLYSPDELLYKLPTGLTVDQTIYCDYLSRGRFSGTVPGYWCSGDFSKSE